jgi:hypothetical protein
VRITAPMRRMTPRLVPTPIPAAFPALRPVPPPLFLLAVCVCTLGDVIVGDMVGDVVGDVMGDVVGDVVGNVVGFSEEDVVDSVEETAAKVGLIDEEVEEEEKEGEEGMGLRIIVMVGVGGDVVTVRVGDDSVEVGEAGGGGGWVHGHCLATNGYEMVLNLLAD